VPALNGYSGNFPPGWTDALLNIGQGGDELREAQRRDVFSWMAKEGLDPQGLCWVEG
jgi:hypothetical protein